MPTKPEAEPIDPADATVLGTTTVAEVLADTPGAVAILDGQGAPIPADEKLWVLEQPATACTGADTCSAASGRWKRATDLAGNATTVTTPDGGMWNRACLATGCPVRTYI